MLVILASLLVMVGGGIGMAYLVQKKNGALDTYEAFSDIMTEEEFEKWQQKSDKADQRNRTLNMYSYIQE